MSQLQKNSFMGRCFYIFYSAKIGPTVKLKEETSLPFLLNLWCQILYNPITISSCKTKNGVLTLVSVAPPLPTYLPLPLYRFIHTCADAYLKRPWFILARGPSVCSGFWSPPRPLLVSCKQKQTERFQSRWWQQQLKNQRKSVSICRETQHLVTRRPAAR